MPVVRLVSVLVGLVARRLRVATGEIPAAEEEEAQQWEGVVLLVFEFGQTVLAVAIGTVRAAAEDCSTAEALRRLLPNAVVHSVAW